MVPRRGFRTLNVVNDFSDERVTIEVDRSLPGARVVRGLELRFIRPGKPIESAHVESFNGKFRDDCLNAHWLISVAEAQAIIEAWRIVDNTGRPYRSLGQLTLAADAAACAAPPQGGGDLPWNDSVRIADRRRGAGGS